MMKIFYPKEEISSVYDINYKELYNKGIRALIYDIDNTLVKHGAKADEHIVELFYIIHNMGFKTILLSNNTKERVESFANEVGSDYIAKAGKPGKKAYVSAMEKLGSGKEDTIFIGDQLFTDIYGANRTGLYSILVKPIDKKEEIQIVFKRKLEAVVLFFYHMRK